MISNKNIIFYLLVFLTLISALFIWSINNGASKYPLINVILETKTDNQDDIVLKVDDKYFLFKQFSDVLNMTIKQKVENIEFMVKKNHKNPIKSVTLFNDKNMNYYSDLKNFEKSSNENYNIYKFKDVAKIKKNSKIINDNNILNSFSKSISVYFSGNTIFLFSYILLFISILYYLNNKNEIKFNQKIFFILILLVTILLRLNNISYFLPWWDEIYSIDTTSIEANIIKIFQDPGNPWFYYLILKIYNLIFHFDFVGMKVLSVIFGIACNVLIYLFLKRHCDIKAANFAFALACINISLIYYSQEIRCYILQACYTIVFTFLIFNLLDKDDKKYYILYFIFLVCAINTHYYQIFLMIANFIFLSIYYFKEKKYNQLLNFSILNFVAILTFLPYFFCCAYQNALLDTSFNDYLPVLSWSLIFNIIKYIFGGVISLFLFIFYVAKMLKNKEINLKIKKIIIYVIYIICAIFILAFIFSLLIRPMIAQKYFIFLFPLQIVLISIIFYFNFKKTTVFLFVFWIFLMQNNTLDNLEQTKRKCLTDVNLLKMASLYKKANKNANVNVIIKRSGYKLDDLYAAEVNYFIVDKYKTDETRVKTTLNIIKKIKEEDENAVIFTSEILPKDMKKTCYFNSSSDMCIYKI